MKIQNITVREIFDTRAESTVEIELTGSDDVRFSAQIPSGKSRGRKEVAVFSFRKAEHILRKIVKKALVGRHLVSIRQLDRELLRLDGTPFKRKLGGNVMLGVSIAFARSLAAERKRELWQVLREEFFPKKKSNKTPVIFSNAINGGSHAAGTLDIQEYMVAVKTARPILAHIKKLVYFYKELGSYLRHTRHVVNIPLGDEAGYALDFKSNFEPIKILERLIQKLRLQKGFSIGVDVAASNFYEKKSYSFEGKKTSTEKLVEIYETYFEKSKLLSSIEDPFAEDDPSGFKMLREKVRSALIVGDDLTTTNAASIQKFSSENCVNGVIIKPNQIGTITETCQAVETAKDNNAKVIVSHRSGETEDTFIIHLAKACGADGLKVGVPVRERVGKFNELIRVYG